MTVLRLFVVFATVVVCANLAIRRYGQDHAALWPLSASAVSAAQTMSPLAPYHPFQDLGGYENLKPQQALILRAHLWTAIPHIRVELLTRHELIKYYMANEEYERAYALSRTNMRLLERYPLSANSPFRARQQDWLIAIYSRSLHLSLVYRLDGEDAARTSLAHFRTLTENERERLLAMSDSIDLSMLRPSPRPYPSDMEPDWYDDDLQEVGNEVAELILELSFVEAALAEDDISIALAHIDATRPEGVGALSFYMLEVEALAASPAHPDRSQRLQALMQRFEGPAFNLMELWSQDRNSRGLRPYLDIWVNAANTSDQCDLLIEHLLPAFGAIAQTAPPTVEIAADQPRYKPSSQVICDYGNMLSRQDGLAHCEAARFTYDSAVANSERWVHTSIWSPFRVPGPELFEFQTPDVLSCFSNSQN